MNRDIKEVIVKVQKLYRLGGYFDRFQEICGENPKNTYKANYHLLEIEFCTIFGRERYSSYHSFVNARTHYYKSRGFVKESTNC